MIPQRAPVRDLRSRAAVARRCLAAGLPALLISLSIAAPAAAQCPLEDAFEPNDFSCVGGALLAPTSFPAVYSGLTIHGLQSPTGFDYDWYRIEVPSGEVLVVDILFSHANANLDLYLFDEFSSGCNNSTWWSNVVRAISTSDDEHLEWKNTALVPVEHYIQVRSASGFDCTEYDLVIDMRPDPCTTLPDDAFEPNDTCAGVVPVADGTYTGLYLDGVDPDYYLLTIEPGHLLRADVFYDQGRDNGLLIILYDDASCSGLGVDFGVGASSGFEYDGHEFVDHGNISDQPQQVILAVTEEASWVCDEYTLVVSQEPHPCFDIANDDAFEPNDDCANAVFLSDGFYQDLFTTYVKEDYYRLLVPAGATLQVDLEFSSQNNLRGLFYKSETICLSGELYNFGVTNGFNGFEDFTYTNNTGAPEELILLVRTQDQPSNDIYCNTYDLRISGTAGPETDVFCAGDGSADVGGGPVPCPCGNESVAGAGEGCINSTGAGGVITALGSPSLTVGDLRFEATQLPANRPAVLVEARNRVALPFRNGLYCMGVPTNRVERVVADATGRAVTTASISEGVGIVPGATRHYQFWYYDRSGAAPCGTGANFTPAVSVLYHP